MFVIVRFFASIAILAFTLAASAADRGVGLGEPTTSKWQFGVVVKAAGSPVSGIRAMLPVPMDWPEQTVKKVGEEKTPGAEISYKVLEAAPGQPGVKQMIVSIARLAAGEEASAIVTLEIRKR